MDEQAKDRAERAVAFHHAQDHNNCAQSVLLAFQNQLGKSAEELKALGDSFGTGMGGMEATCGALTGAAIVLGLLNHSGKPAKLIMNDILRTFRDQAGATLCKDLKGRDTGKMLCACDDCIRIAARELEKHLG